MAFSETSNKDMKYRRNNRKFVVYLLLNVSKKREHHIYILAKQMAVDRRLTTTIITMNKPRGLTVNRAYKSHAGLAVN